MDLLQFIGRGPLDCLLMTSTVAPGIKAVFFAILSDMQEFL
jgi:hypothetical protein